VFRTQRHRAVIVVLFSSILLFQETAYSQSDSPARNLSLVRNEFALAEKEINRCSRTGGAQLSTACLESDARLSIEESALGKRGELIAQAREQALEILEAQNACTAWFQGAGPDAAEVFRSLHYELDGNGTPDLYRVRDKFGSTFFKHPWAAQATEYAGSNSIVRINRNGPFFIWKSWVRDSVGPTAPVVWHKLTIGSYAGDTPEARITIMLHELGHIIGRLAEDDGSWDGQSSRNTIEVLQHCKRDIDLIARKGSHVGN
jgi:hypothetical protein